MCFQIHDKHKEEYVAKEPIQCFKVLKVKDALTLPGYYESVYQQFLYKEGKKYEEEYWGRENKKWFTHTRWWGFHSYTNSLMAFSHRDNWGFDTSHNKVIIEFSIPAGSKYMYNPSNEEYISSEIVCVGYYPLYKAMWNTVAYPIKKFFSKF